MEVLSGYSSLGTVGQRRDRVGQGSEAGTAWWYRRALWMPSQREFRARRSESSVPTVKDLRASHGLTTLPRSTAAGDRRTAQASTRGSEQHWKCTIQSIKNAQHHTIGLAGDRARACGHASRTPHVCSTTHLENSPHHMRGIVQIMVTNRRQAYRPRSLHSE